MKKTCVLLVLSVSLSVFSISQAFAVPLTINDQYVGAEPNDSSFVGRDVIGATDKFDVSHMTVEVNNGVLTVDIFSSYFDNVGQGQTELGDLFISSDGWNPFGNAPYTLDDASNGESWEFALVLSDHGEQYSSDNAGYDMRGESGTLGLYSVDDSSQIEMSDAPGVFRVGQEVQFNPGTGQTLAQGLWSISDQAGDYDRLRLTISLLNTPLADAGSLGFHWGMTCANDVIEGSAAVPEPSTVILLGMALIGGACRPKKRG